MMSMVHTRHKMHAIVETAADPSAAGSADDPAPFWQRQTPGHPPDSAWAAWVPGHGAMTGVSWNRLGGWSIRRVVALGVAAGIVVPVLVLGALFLSDRKSQELENRVRAPMNQYAEMLADSLPALVWNLDAEVSGRLIAAVMRNSNVVQVVVEDENRRIFVSVEQADRRGSEALREERALTYLGRPVGRVMIEMSMARLDQDLMHEQLRQGLALAVQVIVSLGFILLLFDRRIHRPLQQLRHSAGELAQGHLQAPIGSQRPDEIGQLAGVLETMRGNLSALIAERERQNSVLRVAQEKISAIFHASPVAMTVSRVDQDFALEDLNQAFLRLFGGTYEDYLGRNGLQVGLWIDTELRSKLLERLQSNGELYRAQAWLNGADGTQILCEISGKMLHVSGQKLAILCYENITQRHLNEQQVLDLNATLEHRVDERTQALSEAVLHLQTAQSELVRTEKLAALGALVAGIAHELNTPIGVSVTVATTLRDNAQGFEREMAQGLRRSALERFVSGVREGCDLLDRNLLRAAQLIASFKQVAVDQTSENRRLFTLDTTLAEILLTLGPILRKSGHSVRCEIPPGVALDSYPGPLGQVVTNLIHNAFVHGLEGRTDGRVCVRARVLDGNEIELEIEDNGQGIAPQHLDRIFDPFFTTRLGQGGSGLGLNIVYNLVTATLGGRIEVHSQLGQGTRITLRLPRVAPLNAPQDPPTSGA